VARSRTSPRHLPGAKRARADDALITPEPQGRTGTAIAQHELRTPDDVTPEDVTQPAQKGIA